MNLKWRSFMAAAAAVNILSLAGCSAQAAGTSSNDTLASDIKIESSSSAVNIETTSSAAESLAGTATGTPTIVSKAAYELAGGSADKKDEDIASAEGDKSGIKASTGGKLTSSGLKVVTQGNTSSADESKYYGLNAGILAEAGSRIQMESSEITTSGAGANALFATGMNAEISLTKIKISTSGASSRGLNTTYNGTINIADSAVSTEGEDSPAVGTGVGGGAVSVLTGSLKTGGAGSPAVYSTGTVNVTGGKLEAQKSEAAVLDGNGTVNLTDADAVSGGDNGVLMYHSNSVDSSAGTSTFNMVAGSLTSSNSEGALFYVTNTNAAINLNAVEISNTSENLLSAAADVWGTKSENGGNAVLTADNMKISGDILCDMFSTVNISLRNSTAYTGAVNGACSGKEVNLVLDAGSTWDVTADSYITAFTDAMTMLTNIKDNGYIIYYDKSNKANDWLEGKTITLSGGGKLTPDLSKGNIT